MINIKGTGKESKGMVVKKMREELLGPKQEYKRNWKRKGKEGNYQRKECKRTAKE